MNQNTPGFWSRRFRYILFLALRGDFLSSLVALYWFATRRRVRGWCQLVGAANRAPQAYLEWVSASEPLLFDDYRASNPERADANITVLLLGAPDTAPDHTEATVESVKRALGPQTVMYEAGSEAAAAALDVGPRPGRDGSDDWVLPVLAGDILSSATREILERTVQSRPGSALIYWDEDAITREGRADPWIKPGWDELMFSAVDGLAGASLLSLSHARNALGSSRISAFNRGELHQLELAVARAAPKQVVRVPLILTHRSEQARLPSDLPKLAARAAAPAVSILVPTRDRPDLLAACLRGIAASRYPGKIELLIIDNGTEDAEALRLIEEARAAGAVVIRDDGPFNFSRLNNIAARRAVGEFLCLYNNDVEPLDPDWLEHLVGHAVDERTGAVGALLLYPSGRIQHAGVVIGMGGAAGHLQRGVDPDQAQFRTWHQMTREVSAVTAAVMVVRKRHFEAVGGLDEDAFPVAFNDVDLCLRLRQAGLRNIFVSEARLLHRESESRGDDRRPERAGKFARELEALHERWSTVGYDDPYFSPAFLWLSEKCVLIR